MRKNTKQIAIQNGLDTYLLYLATVRENVRGKSLLYPFVHPMMIHVYVI